ncbi:MAG: N-formylglutamate amidohydrolase [Beijerinckiaceae bacterium]
MDHRFDPAFETVAPARASLPFVFNAPHAGRSYPDSFLKQSRLDPHGLRRSEDCHVDRLFLDVAKLGAPLLTAHFPRAFLDVNREPYELDPRMFDGRLPAFANTRSLRVAGGLGSIPRIVGDGQEIYAGRLPVTEALARIDKVYRPYHRALRGLVEEARRRFGEAYLFDCHSMPSASLGPDVAARPDIVLGDRYGTSCSAALIDAAQGALESAGLSVTRNRPYAGGFITEHYGNPASGVHALQIEINRALYMDEDSLEPTAAFEPLREILMETIEQLAARFGALRAWPLAAE